MITIARIVADAPLRLRRRMAPLLGFASAAKLLLRGEDGAVVRLLEAGMDPNCCQKGAQGISLLELALYEHNYEMVHFLVMHDVDVCTARGAALSTPLHLVITMLHEDRENLTTLSCLRLLLDAGADPLAQDRAGMTPFYLAMQLRLWAATDLLAAAAPDIEAMLEPSSKTLPR